jgi:hypothetical protein
MKFLSVPTAVEAVTGTRPHPSTCWRWYIKGSQGVLLKTWMVGGRRRTTVDAVRDFIEQRTAGTTSSAEPSRVRAELERELSR